MQFRSLLASVTLGLAITTTTVFADTNTGSPLVKAIDYDTTFYLRKC